MPFVTTPYELRPCPHCQRPIPAFSSTGERRTPSCYALIKTCGSRACRDRQTGRVDAPGVYYPDTSREDPVDLFLYYLPSPGV